MLEVAGENKDDVEDPQGWYTSSGTMDSGTREIGEPGKTWRREELVCVRP